MRGLQINHQIDAEEFLHFVHDIPLAQFLVPNPGLDQILRSLPHDKVIFTNASREHAQKVLDQLGIRGRFQRIVDIRDLDYESKPQPSAYRRVCELLQVQPDECLLVEDSVHNLRPAKALGMLTVLVRDGHAASEEGVDAVIDRIEEIGEAVRYLESVHQTARS
jgi:putative hydrolase of the HAD superfamily